MKSKSNQLLFFREQWPLELFKIDSHYLNIDEVCTFHEQSKAIKNCKNKYPQISLHISAQNVKRLQKGIYIGQLNQDLKPHGNGIIKYDDGSYLQAKFSQGKVNGKGLMLYPEQHYYVGEFVENNFDGRGQFHTADMSYIGQFKDNKFHGRGELKINKNNSVFDGFMEGGFMKQGTLTWEYKPVKKSSQIKGQIFRYTGKFNNNKFQDENGQLITNIGTYKGGFKNGLKQGRGRFKHVQKYQYVGSYQNNKKNGFGTLYNPEVIKKNGKQVCQYGESEQNISYRGQFKDDLPHGKGVIYSQFDKGLIQGEYQFGILKSTIDSSIK